jgi:protein required for attachment to host cells
VKFINWLGDIKPISIETLKLTYEQVTLGKLKNHINIKKKVKEIAKQLMDYPLKQLEEVILFMLG